MHVVALAALGVLAFASPAAAQSYPSRPIKVIIPASAGGTQDVFMRALGEDLRKRLGQTLVIENRPGGNFNIGARACANSAPDGYTICMLPNEALVYNKLLFEKFHTTRKRISRRSPIRSSRRRRSWRMPI